MAKCIYAKTGSLFFYVTLSSLGKNNAIDMTHLVWLLALSHRALS